MKPSDVLQLQRKLELLQQQLNRDDDQSDTEEAPEPERHRTIPAYDDSGPFKNRNLCVDDFHVSTTLGTVMKHISI
jgi:hypothetical protein